MRETGANDVMPAFLPRAPPRSPHSRRLAARLARTVAVLVLVLLLLNDANLTSPGVTRSLNHGSPSASASSVTPLLFLFPLAEAASAQAPLCGPLSHASIGVRNLYHGLLHYNKKDMLFCRTIPREEARTAMAVHVYSADEMLRSSDSDDGSDSNSSNNRTNHSRIARHFDTLQHYFVDYYPTMMDGVSVPAPMACQCTDELRCKDFYDPWGRNLGRCECCEAWVVGLIAAIIAVLALAIICFFFGRHILVLPWLVVRPEPPRRLRYPESRRQTVCPPGVAFPLSVFRGYRCGNFVDVTPGGRADEEEDMVLVQRDEHDVGCFRGTEMAAEQQVQNYLNATLQARRRRNLENWWNNSTSHQQPRLQPPPRTSEQPPPLSRDFFSLRLAVNADDPNNPAAAPESTVPAPPPPPQPPAPPVPRVEEPPPAETGVTVRMTATENQGFHLHAEETVAGTNPGWVHWHREVNLFAATITEAWSDDDAPDQQEQTVAAQTAPQPPRTATGKTNPRTRTQASDLARGADFGVCYHLLRGALWANNALPEWSRPDRPAPHLSDDTRSQTHNLEDAGGAHGGEGETDDERAKKEEKGSADDTDDAAEDADDAADNATDAEKASEKDDA